MKKTYFSEKIIKERHLSHVLTFLVAFTMIAIGVVIAITTPGAGKYACYVFFMGLSLFLIHILCELYISREYALDENGIHIQYAKRKTCFFPWTSISQICICRVHYNKVGSYNEVIWCTVGAIKKGPPNMARRWGDSLYQCLHYHDVLLMEYTPERLEEFQKYYNRDIPDYRDVIYR